MKSIDMANLQSGIKVFVRGDLDVAIENGVIKETFRLDRLLPTLNYLKEKSAKIVIAGHIGRPQENKERISTQVLLPYFNAILGEGTFELLENLRFSIGEEANNLEFAKSLSEKADIYVNDCFGTCHRKHASIVGIPKFLPHYAGFDLLNEIINLSKVFNPAHPFVAIIGGAKLETKKPIIKELLNIADYVLVGGKIGMDWNEDVPENLIFPIDYAREKKDIGVQTVEKFTEIILNAKTVLWAGPLGVYEEDEFNKGNMLVAKAVFESGAYSILGGGGIVAALNKPACAGRLGLLSKFNFISTGGGATLEYLVKHTLPGIEALNNNG